MLSLAPDGLSGATPLRDRPALQPNYLSTRDRGAGQTRQEWRYENRVRVKAPAEGTLTDNKRYNVNQIGVLS